MDGVTLSVGETLFSGYLLALARVAGFALVAPPFNTRGVPARIRASFVIAMAIPLSAWTTPTAPPLASGALFGRMLLQLLLGSILGFFILLAVAAIQTVGDLIDVVGGFSITMAMDPLNMVQSSVMGRLHQLMAIALLFTTNLHLTVLQGLTRSLQVMPDPEASWPTIGRGLVSEVAAMFLAAVQVAAPLIAAMLIADLALGLLTRAAPALNAFALAFPLKILLTLLLVGLVIAQMPDVLRTVIDRAIAAIIVVTGTGSG